MKWDWLATDRRVQAALHTVICLKISGVAHCVRRTVTVYFTSASTPQFTAGSNYYKSLSRVHALRWLLWCLSWLRHQLNFPRGVNSAAVICWALCCLGLGQNIVYCTQLYSSNYSRSSIIGFTACQCVVVTGLHSIVSPACLGLVNNTTRSRDHTHTWQLSTWLVVVNLCVEAWRFINTPASVN